MNLQKEHVFRVPMGAGSLSRDVWTSKQSKFYHACSHSPNKFPSAEVNTHPNRYLMIATSGGLNQQRTGIVDAVVAAHILNAVLVVPKLDQKSYGKIQGIIWNNFNFSEIFDVDWFILRISKDVKIVRNLPKIGDKVITPYTTRVPRKCNVKCYQTRILPILKKKHAVQLTKFDYRLSNRLDTDLQKLRCRVNYHALKFTDPIIEMSRTLVERIRMKSKHFVALHLRFEPDMLAFSGCYYGGGDKERKELGKIRKRWKTLHTRNPDKERRHGKCPLTPEEIGLMLRALGFVMFLYPITMVIWQESSPEEGDILITSRLSAQMLRSRNNMTWEEFASQVRTSQIGFMGEPMEVKPGRGEFHENPSACICADSEMDSGSATNSGRRDMVEITDSQVSEEEQEWSDTEYMEINELEIR
ncbi:hypothetical protein K7X08_008632 [Anisodus acutangulus]|uniref:O-fucosyltransferase family protein n=1 Tax=Anisodus acutangulus TaxID=402998 RepID=A0A9Q1RTA7_9SOLA|nr:hypothetical protein K7X08_008632 [Anisodus acutangulus]